MSKKKGNTSDTFQASSSRPEVSDDEIFAAVLSAAVKGDTRIVEKGIHRCDLNKLTPLKDNLLSETLFAYHIHLMDTNGQGNLNYPEVISIITHSEQVRDGKFDLSTPNPSGADALVLMRETHEMFKTAGTQKALDMIERAVQKQQAFHSIAHSAGQRKKATVQPSFTLPDLKRVLIFRQSP